MKGKAGNVYGIGNPLIDVIVNVSDNDLELLGLHKLSLIHISEPTRH